MAYEEKLTSPALKFAAFLDKFPTVYNVYVVAVIACFSAVMFGFDISSMSALLLSPAYLKYFDSPSTNMQSFITASMSLGSFFGSFASTFVSEPFGRRASLFVCSFFWCIGAAIQSSAQNRAQLIIGRFISGVGVGFGSTVAPVYTSEVSPRNRRGFVGGIFQLCVTIGILVMYYIAFGLQHINGLAAFRIPWAIQIVPGLILVVGLFFIPESPRWLAKQEQWEQCENIVAQVEAKDRTHPDVITEIAEIREQLIIEENAKAFKYSDLLKKKYAFRTFNAVFAQIWQQLTGMNALMYYVVYIFDMAGYSGNTNLIASSIQYVLNVVMTVPALFLMELVGRRTILITGAIFMLIWHFAIGGLLATYAESVPNGFEGAETIRIRIPENHKTAAKGVIACSYLFVCSYASSWGVVCWVYCAEVWGENAARQRGASLTTGFNWLFNFSIGMFTPPSFKNITWKTYMIFGAFCTCMALHVFFVFPETRGKRLEEIGQMWDNRVPAWKTDKWQPYVPVALDEFDKKHEGDTEHKEHQETSPSFNNNENLGSASDESHV